VKCKIYCIEITNSALTGVRMSFFIRFFAQTVHARRTRINYKTVPVTNFNVYLHYGTMEMSNMYINMGVNNANEK